MEKVFATVWCKFVIFLLIDFRSCSLAINYHGSYKMPDLLLIPNLRSIPNNLQCKVSPVT